MDKKNTRFGIARESAFCAHYTPRTGSFCLLIYLWIILIFIVMAFGSLLAALAWRLVYSALAIGFLFINNVCYFN